MRNFRKMTPIKKLQKSQPRPVPVQLQRQNAMRKKADSSSMTTKTQAHSKEPPNKYQKLSNRAQNLLNNFRKRIEKNRQQSEDEDDSSEQF